MCGIRVCAGELLLVKTVDLVTWLVESRGLIVHHISFLCHNVRAVSLELSAAPARRVFTCQTTSCGQDLAHARAYVAGDDYCMLRPVLSFEHSPYCVGFVCDCGSRLRKMHRKMQWQARITIK